MSRIRANQITNQSADGAPTVQHGLIIAGVSTFTGSVSIGGTLTYEDVTNIDSIGIVTARNGIDCNGDLDVDGHTNLDNVNVVGVTTFNNRIEIDDNTIRDNISAGNNLGIMFSSAGGGAISPTAGNGTLVNGQKDFGENSYRWRNGYFTTLYGNGSNLTGITGTTINSNADNRIITGSGTANTLNGEANLLFNGSTFQVSGEGYVTGNFSVGEPTPDRKLHVKSGSNSTDGAFRIESANGNIMDMGTDGTGHFLNCVNADPFRIKFAGSEKIRIDTSGRLLVGKTGANLNAQVQIDGRYVDCSSTTVDLDTSGSVGPNLKLHTSSNTANHCAAIVFDHGSLKSMIAGGRINTSNWGTDLRFYTHPESTSNVHQTFERMRITSGGEVCIASSQVNNGARLNIASNGNHITCKSHATGGYYSIYFRSANTNVGNIYFNSGGTQYNTGSDYRLKQNIVSLTGAIDRIKTLSPKRFNFISESGVTRDGFLAHEVTTVPEAITGTKDAISTADDVAVGISTYVGEPIYQTIDQSKLVPLLTAALQEAVAKIEVLETKVAALEGS